MIEKFTNCINLAFINACDKLALHFCSTLGISADNIIKCLKAYDSSDIVMEMTDAGRPIVVRSEDNSNMTVLSMPMQIVG